MNNIKTQIDILCNIQNVCIKKQKLISEVEAIPDKIASIENTIKSYEDDLEAEKKRLLNHKHIYRKFENDIDDCLLSIYKSKDKLCKIKSNKEYQLTLKELEILKKKQTDIENLMLNQLEKIDNIKKAINKKKTLTIIRKETLLSEKNNILVNKLKTELIIKTLAKKKKKIRYSVDSKILSTFDSVSKKVKGIAIAPVRNSICFGCNMSIPPQLYNEIQKLDKLKYCPYCQRIIYWQNSKVE